MSKKTNPLYKPGDILLQKYCIEALIGKGAFGEVYRVAHEKLKVTRAVKILRRDAPGIGSTEVGNYNSRFQLEAQLGARLNTPTPHPNLLQVHAYEDEGELILQEMEYAPGGSLAKRIQESKEEGESIPVDEVVQVGLEVARGLAALHELDVVHRDLKPSNILFDDKRRAKVADLGLAQTPDDFSFRRQLSEPEKHPGTPGYMSPEQENSVNVLRPPSDVYALGIVLFEMLTGRNYTYLKPGTHASELRPDLPAWLDELLARMLSDEPKNRPWDGAEVARLLRKGRERKKIKIHSWVWAVAGGLMIMGVVWWASTLVPLTHQPEPPIAVVANTSTFAPVPPNTSLPTKTQIPTATKTKSPTIIPTRTQKPDFTPTQSATITVTSYPTAEVGSTILIYLYGHPCGIDIPIYVYVDGKLKIEKLYPTDSSSFSTTARIPHTVEIVAPDGANSTTYINGNPRTVTWIESTYYEILPSDCP